MASVWFSLWVAMLAVLIATVPFHLVLHGIVAYRIAQQEGWGAVLRRGRYLSEIRANRTLSRMMLGWLGIAFIEICALITLSALVIATRASAPDPNEVQIGSLPESGDILLVSDHIVWRLDTDKYTITRSIIFPRYQSIFASSLHPLDNLTYLHVADLRTVAAEKMSFGVFEFQHNSGEFNHIFNNQYTNSLIAFETMSPDGTQSLIQYQGGACLLDMASGDCPVIPLPPEDFLRLTNWVADDLLISYGLWSDAAALMRYDFEAQRWQKLVEIELVGIAAFPNQNALLIQRPNDLTIHDLDKGTFDTVANTRHQPTLVRLIVSPDGKRAAVIDAQQLTVFDLASGEMLYEYPIATGRAVWMQDSTHLVMYGGDLHRLTSQIQWFANWHTPIKTRQSLTPFTTLMIVNVETGAIEQTLELEDAPKDMILLP